MSGRHTLVANRARCQPPDDLRRHANLQVRRGSLRPEIARKISPLVRRVAATRRRTGLMRLAARSWAPTSRSARAAYSPARASRSSVAGRRPPPGDAAAHLQQRPAYDGRRPDLEGAAGDARPRCAPATAARSGRAARPPRPGRRRESALTSSSTTRVCSGAEAWVRTCSSTSATSRSRVGESGRAISSAACDQPGQAAAHDRDSSSSLVPM